MATDKILLWCLFGLFAVVNIAFLHRVPGLLGDEASEGENVYELLARETYTVVGERSYIGPVIDYIRIPFIAAFGYTTLGVRIPIFIFSIATFWLAWGVLKNHFGDVPALFALAFFAFSPMYILYQRLGWAITLFPFFAFLALRLAQTRWQQKWLWVGLAAGLGLSNHILFLPTISALIIGMVIFTVLNQIFFSGNTQHAQFVFKSFCKATLFTLVGFWAGFGMQFTVLQLHQDDQGDPEATTQLFPKRFSDFITAAPLYISGSSFAAQYTGREFSSQEIYIVMSILAVLLIFAGLLQWRSIWFWSWVGALVTYAVVMLYVIDRFNLRYFIVFALGVWGIAGLGLGSAVQRYFWSHSRTLSAAMLLVPVFLLTGWIAAGVVVPFLRTGGIVAEFSLGNRTNNAAAFVAIDPLVECLLGKGPVYSEDIHIWNRLQYLSHEYSDLIVLPEGKKDEARILVEYRNPELSRLVGVCQELLHFEVHGLTD